MAKPRVHEIAKELGVSSKDLIAKLNELGEYVKGPSSTLEAPVVRKARDAFPTTKSSATAAEKPAASAKPAAKPAAGPKPGPKPAPKPAPEAAPVAEEPTPAPAPQSAPKPAPKPAAEKAAPAAEA
uniref:translation initiation factor IF-2 N-terminal domain-containing protein n=1 Tax=Demequina gelatinilytica TaxID=1638980 RepID=UPI000ACC6489